MRRRGVDDDSAPIEHSWSVGMGSKLCQYTIFQDWNKVVLISCVLLAQNRRPHPPPVQLFGHYLTLYIYGYNIISRKQTPLTPLNSKLNSADKGISLITKKYILKTLRINTSKVLSTTHVLESYRCPVLKLWTTTFAKRKPKNPWYKNMHKYIQLKVLKNEIFEVFLSSNNPSWCY